LVGQAGHLPSVDLVKVRNGEAKAVNVKDGSDNVDGVSARASGFLLMIEKFQDKVSITRIGRASRLMQKSSFLTWIFL
jgi:hypothetical protein